MAILRQGAQWAKNVQEDESDDGTLELPRESSDFHIDSGNPIHTHWTYLLLRIGALLFHCGYSRRLLRYSHFARIRSVERFIVRLPSRNARNGVPSPRLQLQSNK